MTTLELIARTIMLTGLTTAVSMAVAVAAALLHPCLNKAGRYGLTGVALICWLTPPFLYVDSWMSTFREPLLLIPPMSIFWCGVVLAFGLWPIGYLLLSSAVRRMDIPGEARTTGLDGPALLRWVVIPGLLAPMATTMLIVAGLAWSAFTIPSLFNVQVISAELWIRFNTGIDGTSVMLPALIQAVVPLTAGFLALRRLPAIFDAPPVDMPPDQWRQSLGASTIIGLTPLVILLPLGALSFGILQLIPMVVKTGELWAILQSNTGPLTHSAVIAGASTLAALGVGILLSPFRWSRMLWGFFFVPGVCLSLGMSSLLNSPVLSHYHYGIEMVVVVCTLRFAPVSIFLCSLGASRHDKEAGDFIRMTPMSYYARLRWVYWPGLRRYIPGLSAIIFTLCLWDTEAAVMITPPGGESAAQRIFGFLHYGHTSQVTGLTLLLTIVGCIGCMVPFVIRYVSTKWLSRPLLCLAAGVSLMMVSGCGKSDLNESTGPVRLPAPSRFFSSVEVIGGRGNGAGLFQKPRSLEVAGDGTLFVSDMTGRVQRFSPAGQFMQLWQMPETELGRPKGMAIDHDGNLMVIEPHYGRVNHFSLDGSTTRQWGQKGREPGKLDLPRGILPWKDRQYITCEFGGHDRLQWFDDQGQFTGKAVGSMGAGPDQLNRPEGMDIDPHGNILIADSNNHRIQVVSPEGEFLKSIGDPGSEEGQFSYPFDILCDDTGHIFICEFGNSRIQIFDRDWQFLESVGRLGRSPGEFFNPWTLAMDAGGNLYVADSMNHRVQKLIRTRKSGKPIADRNPNSNERDIEMEKRKP